MSKLNILEVSKLEVINMGIKEFDESNKRQNVESVHIDWRPPAGGNVKLLKILERLEKLQ